MDPRKPANTSVPPQGTNVSALTNALASLHVNRSSANRSFANRDPLVAPSSAPSGAPSAASSGAPSATSSGASSAVSSGAGSGAPPASSQASPENANASIRTRYDGLIHKPTERKIEFLNSLLEDLDGAGFTDLSHNDGHNGTYVIHFKTPETSLPCHLTLHLGDADDKGKAGAFHVKIDEPKGSLRLYPRLNNDSGLYFEKINYTTMPALSMDILEDLNNSLDTLLLFLNKEENRFLFNSKTASGFTRRLRRSPPSSGRTSGSSNPSSGRKGWSFHSSGQGSAGSGSRGYGSAESGSRGYGSAGSGSRGYGSASRSTPSSGYGRGRPSSGSTLSSGNRSAGTQPGRRWVEEPQSALSPSVKARISAPNSSSANQAILEHYKRVCEATGRNYDEMFEKGTNEFKYIGRYKKKKQELGADLSDGDVDKLLQIPMGGGQKTRRRHKMIH
jgi:hypothetical protein